MNLPDEAVDAATDALQQFSLTQDRDGLQAWDAYARATLEAAAPHMLAGVRGLHVQRSGDYVDRDGIDWYGEHCGHCRVEWPCATIEVLP